MHLATVKKNHMSNFALWYQCLMQKEHNKEQNTNKQCSAKWKRSRYLCGMVPMGTMMRLILEDFVLQTDHLCGHHQRHSLKSEIYIITVSNKTIMPGWITAIIKVTFQHTTGLLIKYWAIKTKFEFANWKSGSNKQKVTIRIYLEPFNHCSSWIADQCLMHFKAATNT